MFKRILLATDGSRSAEEAARYASDLALQYGAQVIVVYAFPSVPKRLGEPYQEQFIKSHIAEGQHVVNPVAERLRDAGVYVDVEVLDGPPADAIMRVADARDCDLIVMGSRGHGGLASLMLGSVSHRVLAHAHVPVLVARANGKNARSPYLAREKDTNSKEEKMNIPIGIEVHCTDGVCGESTYVIINPVGQKVTHVVVKDRKRPHTERLVNIKWVAETTDDLIRLGCTQAELAKMKPFVETQFLDESLPDYDGFAESEYFLWPYRVPDKKVLAKVKHKSIPPGELAVRRGARVHCTDGVIGRVDEFLVDPTDGHITHLVLREGHVWAERDVAISVSEIQRIEEQDVFLSLDKKAVKALSAIPTQPVNRVEVEAIEFPIGAKVHCTDGVCGESSYVIVNPVSQKVTHLVVKDRKYPHTERLVPVKWVKETDDDLVRLRCTHEEMRRMKSFHETHFLRQSMEENGNIGEGFLLWPYRVPVKKEVRVQDRRIPPGELAVRRGALVHCTDGRIGRVDEFLLDPADGHITHLVLRKGHLWGERDVTVPLSQIRTIEEEAVYLKLDKRSVEALPTIAVRRP